MTETFILAGLALLTLAGLVFLVVKSAAHSRALQDLAARQTELNDQRHRAMLLDLHDGLTKQGDRLATALTDSSERQRNSTAEELKATRDTLHALRLSLSENLG